MAQTRRTPVFGLRPPCASQSRLYECITKMERTRLPYITEGLIYEKKKNCLMKLYTMLNTSYNFVDYIRNREYGIREYRSVNKNCGMNHVLTHDMLKEWCIPLKTMNKVFCSQWLSSNQIVFGTKCNKLMVYDVNSHNLEQIPLIKDHAHGLANKQNGIRSIKINPSRTLLATGAYNSNGIAVYRLPTLDPIALAKGAHSDSIFDIEWLDNEFFVSGSRDTKVALWKVQDKYQENYDSDGDLILPVTQFIDPLDIKTCHIAQNFRAINFNNKLKEMFTLSLNGHVTVWDVEHFKQIFSKKVSACQDNTCMAMKSDGDLIAFGCCSYTPLLDTRTLYCINKVSVNCSGFGVKSLSFQDNIITIGHAAGGIVFYDLRAGKYLESSINSNTEVVLNPSKGYINHEQLLNQEIQQVNYMPAVYTHCYDYSGIKLFSAGGPLPADVCGNYAGIWQ